MFDLPASSVAQDKKRAREAEDGSEKRQKFASGEDEKHWFPYSLVTMELSPRK
jgi:hypothetical protein